MYAAILLVVSGFASARSAPPNPGKIYAVIFDVAVNPAGKVDTLKVAKVIDPSTHSMDAVIVAGPDSYLSAAKTLLIKTNCDPDPTHFNTWLAAAAIAASVFLHWLGGGNSDSLFLLLLLDDATKPDEIIVPRGDIAAIGREPKVTQHLE
jgi:hypothetical protein